jgi:N-glycosylase/DNA lyase
MLDRLRTAFGEPLGRVVDGDGERVVYAFPSVEALGRVTEAELRALGCGYRARFIRESAISIAARGGDAYLAFLRTQPREAVQTALLDLIGVGRKVADCVALFALDKASAVPVDTHVWTIACRDYDATLVDAKSLTPRVYERVGDLFRARFSEHAGWAHSLLFTAELPAFRSLLPEAIIAEMASFREFEREEKSVKRAAARDRKLARDAAAVPETTEAAHTDATSNHKKRAAAAATVVAAVPPVAPAEAAPTLRKRATRSHPK